MTRSSRIRPRPLVAPGISIELPGVGVEQAMETGLGVKHDSIPPAPLPLDPPSPLLFPLASFGLPASAFRVCRSNQASALAGDFGPGSDFRAGCPARRTGKAGRQPGPSSASNCSGNWSGRPPTLEAQSSVVRDRCQADWPGRGSHRIRSCRQRPVPQYNRGRHVEEAGSGVIIECGRAELLRVDQPPRSPRCRAQSDSESIWPTADASTPIKVLGGSRKDRRGRALAISAPDLVAAPRWAIADRMQIGDFRTGGRAAPSD